MGRDRHTATPAIYPDTRVPFQQSNPTLVGILDLRVEGEGGTDLVSGLAGGGYCISTRPLQH